MRITTWNCWGGECRARGLQVHSLRSDIIVLQECTAPSAPQDDACLWFFQNGKKGVGVLARGEWRVSAGPMRSEVPDSVFPVIVSGPSAFHMLAVWTAKRPTYVRALSDAVGHYREFLTTAPAVIIGDFNSHPQFDKRKSDWTHARLVSQLEDEYGLVSAYHAAPGRSAEAPEEPTLYWQWKENQPFHIDYCFLPAKWVPHIKSVEVGTYADWQNESDHRPLTVDVSDSVWQL